MIGETSQDYKTGTNLGPHGVGDPEDKSLRKVETQVLVPKKMREKAKTEKCLELVQAFQNCCKDHGLTMVYQCRKENAKMKECLTYWFQNPEFRQECQEEYLDERSEFRRTGIRKKLKSMRS